MASTIKDIIYTVVMNIEGGEVKPIVTLPSNGTVFELKGKIEAETGVAVARQTLYSAGSKLDDFKTIDSYFDFTEIGTVRLVVQPPPPNTTFKIAVFGLCEQYFKEFEVKETETVLELKQKIEAELKSREGMGYDEVRPRDMILTVVGVVMKPEQPLSKYYLHQGSRLRLRLELDNKKDTPSSSTSISRLTI